ncbi:coat protein [Neofusicoccum parvum victorivirus 2]|uniref:Coat protein n=1 Tax=Neofusicoccum parvum victorivirus 2 TaxID=2818055 RepID=A0A8A5D5Y1_9VIRU|nr:coat protein [Neofusicoccum parvum victorivirus 2]
MALPVCCDVTAEQVGCITRRGLSVPEQGWGQVWVYGCFCGGGFRRSQRNIPLLNKAHHTSRAMAETPVSHQAYPAPLVGALADPQGGGINADNLYRRYRAALRVRVPERGNFDTSVRSIFYEVGRRYGNARDALAPPAEAAVPIDCSVPINPAEAANFEGMARRFSNFAPQWVMMDLTAMVERLGRAVAAASVYGQNLSTTALRGGAPIQVIALGTLDSPQTASSSSVFIPRTVDTVATDHVFAVLCAAANGAGASVTTDVVRLDANTNQPIVPAVAGAAFTGACVEALRVLGANFEASGAGDLFAYALTRGIHAVVSVVSHTDEGGVMRSILRYDRFRVPYGGINQALREYPALPPLASVAQTAVASWVDAIALKTAALTAHCDPLVAGEGGLFPTVFVASGGPPSAPGTDEGAVTDAHAASIGRQFAADLGRFAPAYCRGLTQLFGLRSNSGIAEQHLCTAGSRSLSRAGADLDRHLRHKTVAPYFWIEPTSLIPHDFLGTPAEANDFGAKCSPQGPPRSQPLFERHEVLARGSTANFMTMAFTMRTARTSAYVAAYAAAPTPLAEIRLYQYDESAIVLPGDNGPTNGDVAAKHAAADPLPSYLWTRGQSCLPAPAEFINTQGGYGARVCLVRWDDDWDATRTEVFDELDLQGSIEWMVTNPAGIATGPSNAADRQAKRARTRAATALAQALQRGRGLGSAHSPVMEVSNVPPAFGPAAGSYQSTDQDRWSASIGPTSVDGVGSGTGGVHAPQYGAPLNPTVHHQPNRGPRPAAPAPGGPRGGGPQPPAPAAGPAGGPPPPPAPPAGGPVAPQAGDAADPLPAPHNPPPAQGGAAAEAGAAPQI